MSRVAIYLLFDGAESLYVLSTLSFDTGDEMAQATDNLFT